MKDLKKKTEKELEKVLAEKRGALRKFRFGTSGSKNKNVKEGLNLKKGIAQIFTILREREIENNNNK